MANWKDTPIPAEMQELTKDNRGYTIPFIVLRDDHNKPHFQINDTKKIMDCLLGRRCAICGKELKDDIWLTSGPLSAFHPNGAYIDTPVHHACGQYAMQVCPYLAAPAYNKRLDDKTLSKKNFSGKSFLDP